MVLKSIDGGMLKEMYLSGCALLNQNREAVDALNVFPVPDGDTGTNMSQTMNAAVKELNSRPFSSVSDVASAAARGALRGARGNSGVILSQILRGIASALEGHDDMDAALLVKALRAGAQTAYKAVMKPKEGTILTVARVIAEEVESRFTGKEDIIEIFTIAVKSGDAILKRTPDMLPVLKQAGVVDSGGKGLMVIYSGFLSALTGSPVESLAEAPSAPLPAASFMPCCIAGINSLGMQPPTVLFSNTKPEPGSPGLNSTTQWPYWPCPPVWRTNLPSVFTVLVRASR